MHRLLLTALLVLLTACSGTASPSAAPESTVPPAISDLVVTWVVDGTLSAWASGDTQPRTLAGADISRAVLSPDGQHSVFTRRSAEGGQSLWLADVPAGDVQQVVMPDALPDALAEGETSLFDQLIWLDAGTLLFNTRRAFPHESGYMTEKADDLWQLSLNPLNTPEVVQLQSAGSGGDFTPSPDGTHLVLTTAGLYGSTPGELRLLALATNTITPLMAFDAVSTGSEWRFYPTVDWLPDSSGFRTALPDPDLIYGTGSAHLWTITLDGTTQETGTLPANFFGLPRWSADGEWLTYLETTGAPAENQLALILANADGTAPQQIVAGSAGTLEPPRWFQNQFTFTHGQPGERWLGRPGAGGNPVLMRFPQNEGALDLAWANANTAVYAAAYTNPANGEAALRIRVTTLPEGTTMTITEIGAAFPQLDAVHTP